MKRIITIGREFGAGGGELGRRLAREMNIAYYDRDIILKTAKASAHLTPEQVRRWDERVPHEFGFTQSLFNFYNRPLSEELWDAQVRCRTRRLTSWKRIWTALTAPAATTASSIPARSMATAATMI